MTLDQGPEPKDILDIGCSTGLSTLKLAQTFPSARITGVDLSPHMLAVGRFKLRTREDQRAARGRVEYLHAAGEMTGLADASMDLVSLSLTSHELPVEATRCACVRSILCCSVLCGIAIVRCLLYFSGESCFPSCSYFYLFNRGVFGVVESFGSAARTGTARTGTARTAEVCFPERRKRSKSSRVRQRPACCHRPLAVHGR